MVKRTMAHVVKGSKAIVVSAPQIHSNKHDTTFIDACFFTPVYERAGSIIDHLITPMSDEDMHNLIYTTDTQIESVFQMPRQRTFVNAFVRREIKDFLHILYQRLPKIEAVNGPYVRQWAEWVHERVQTAVEQMRYTQRCDWNRYQSIFKKVCEWSSNVPRGSWQGSYGRHTDEHILTAALCTSMTQPTNIASNDAGLFLSTQYIATHIVSRLPATNQHGLWFVTRLSEETLIRNKLSSEKIQSYRKESLDVSKRVNAN